VAHRAPLLFDVHIWAGSERSGQRAMHLIHHSVFVAHSGGPGVVGAVIFCNAAAQTCSSTAGVAASAQLLHATIKEILHIAFSIHLSAIVCVSGECLGGSRYTEVVAAGRCSGQVGSISWQHVCVSEPSHERQCQGCLWIYMTLRQLRSVRA
jgi:hypothetical protein